ncbi:plant UBX domain-containing protein 7-like [Papaver somniferum]|uniref:plant UBX domain-containing protein 7-like n=1 Tax=Papaver somniferum TaxID=3469 RepID=UPI000E705FFC|nr:plant UBX domain-containing protein 7-like [Papaver somniferum]
MVEISEVDSASNLPVVHGMASQMGPPPPNPPRSGQVHGPSVGIGSTAGSSTPSSQPSQTCAADECVSNNPEVGVQISWVWGHYNIYQNGERAKCKHCEISNYKIGECFKKKEKRKEKRKEKKKKLEKAIQLSETGANLSSSFAPPEESSPPLADQSPGRDKGISSSGQGSGRSVEVLAPLPVEREDSFDDPLYRAAAMGHPSLEPSSMVALGATSTSDNSRDDLALFHGPPFVKIKQEAADQNKWLLVNVESIKMEFGSDMLNRATWDDKVVAQLIRTKFIFWQVHDDTTEGRQVCNYYNLVSVPVVLLLDPISGKKMRLWSGMIRPRPLLKVLLPLVDGGPKDNLEQNIITKIHHIDSIRF